MPTDFHYIPPAPEPIEGDDVLTQTEDAINSLGAQVDSALSLAQSADSKASDALDAANSAKSEADKISEIIGDGYTSGNGGIGISGNSISLVIDPSTVGLNVASSGLQLNIQTLFPASGGFGYENNAFSVDFTQMPTDKFEELLKSIRVPIWLSRDTTWYVRTDGNNSNDGLSNSASGAFKTIQYALQYISENFNLGTHDAIISVQSGIFNENIVFPKYNASTGVFRLVGSGKGVTTIICDFTNVPAAGQFDISGFTIRNTGIANLGSSSVNSLMTMVNGITLNFIGCAFDMSTSLQGSATSTNLFVADQGSQIILFDSNEVSASQFVNLARFFSVDGAYIQMRRSISVSGYITNGIFAYVANLGLLRIGSPQEGSPNFNGSITSSNVLRYAVLDNSVINTGGRGDTFFPGDQPGEGHGYYS